MKVLKKLFVNLELENKKIMTKYLIAAFPVTNVPRSDASGGDFGCVVFVVGLVCLVGYIIYKWWEVNK